MKLSKLAKDAFILAVMQDVPQIDYSELIRTAVQMEAIALLPTKVRAIYDDKKLRGYLRFPETYLAGQYINVPTNNERGHYKPSPEVMARIENMKAKRDEQDEQMRDLKLKLQGIVNSCATRKALAEALPEFIKYLPEDTTPTADRSLPAIANVVAEFVKAGWPKGESKAA